MEIILKYTLLSVIGLSLILTIKEFIHLYKSGYSLNPLTMISGEGIPLIIVGQPDNFYAKFTSIVLVFFTLKYIISKIYKYFSE